MSFLRVSLVTVTCLSLWIPLGCGGGGGGGSGGKGGGKITTFRVTAIDPDSGKIGLANDTQVIVILTTPVDMATVSDATLFITRDDNGVPQPGFFEFSDDRMRITWRPDPWLDTATSYTVTVRGLLDEDGQALVRERVSTFTTGPYPSPIRVVQAQFQPVLVRMGLGRSSHTSTLLVNGFVLIAGGYGSGLFVTATAELYDPAREDFIVTSGDMGTARGNHTATLLQTGLVLIAGGERAGDFRGHATAELFSTATSRFLSAGSMAFERTFHTATLLPDGRVLVTGGRTIDGQGQTVFHSSAEIYTTTTDSWTRTTNDLDQRRSGHRATLLKSGLVLITGGSGNRVAEIFDPATNLFRPVVAPMEAVRSLHGAVLFDDGTVLLSGGGSDTGEIFEPTTETFSPTGNTDSSARSAALTFQFRPGEVLSVGGIDFSVSFIHASLDQYDRDYGEGGRYFAILPRADHGVILDDPRAFSAATRLRDGRFLITGGLGPAFNSPDLDTALLFTPADN